MILGLVAAKLESKRFPFKNRRVYKGFPLFWHAVQPLKEAVDEVVVITNDDAIREYCVVNGVVPIPYPENTAMADAPLLDVLRFAYQRIDKRCEMVITIMANCPGHTKETVKRAISMMRSGHFWEIRSFGDSGEENGLMAFSPHVLNQPAISSHIGQLRDEAFEIHSLEDVET